MREIRDIPIVGADLGGLCAAKADQAFIAHGSVMTSPRSDGKEKAVVIVCRKLDRLHRPSLAR
jgi:hypothetical protein